MQDAEYKKSWYQANKERISVRNAEYYAKNREEVIKRTSSHAKANRAKVNKNLVDWRANNRHKITEYYRKSKYGITPMQFDQMLSDQNNSCYLCEQTFLKKPNIDHNHETGKVRKLLCTSCNVAIGLLQDDSKLMRKCAKYVEEH